MIETVLTAVERRLAVDAGRFAIPWDELLTFLTNFVEGEHAQVEDQVLFPTLSSAGMTTSGGPLGVMTAEHQRLRELLAEFHRARREGDRTGAVQTTRAVVRLLRDHLSKEDLVLFVLAERVLSAADRAQVFESMARRAEGGGASARAAAMRAAARICEGTGLRLPPLPERDLGSDVRSTYREETER